MEPGASPVSVAVEGMVDEVVVCHLLGYVGLVCGRVYVRSGKGALLQRLRSYNLAARFAPWLVVVDLDQDAECAPPFVRTVLPNPAPNLQLSDSLQRCVRALRIMKRDMQRPIDKPK